MIAKRSLITLGPWLLLSVPQMLRAQHVDRGGDHTHVQGLGLTALAREQIRQVEAATHDLRTTDAAERAGFRPALGWIPSMGVHWVSRDRMLDGFDLLKPDHLMFSQVDGVSTLVGVAYAFRDSPDARIPDGFDGTMDQWHDHPRLAPGDATLHMLHVWFVDSPDGPFAPHNPWLPFYAVGLRPPDSSVEDSALPVQARALSLALAATVEPTFLDRLFERFVDQDAQQVVADRRASIQGLVPLLDHAERSADWVTWSQLAGKALDHWEGIRAAWLDAAPFPVVRRRLDAYVSAMTGGGHHE